MRSVKYAPQGQIVGSVLKLLLGPGGDEQDVARLERLPPVLVKEDTSPANNEVDLVLRVRRLLPRALRDGKGYIKGAAPQNHDGVLACGSGDTRLSIGKTHHAATIRLAHGSLLEASN
jgi:hypothetical protein